MAANSIHRDLVRNNLARIKLLLAYGLKFRVKALLMAFFLVSIPWLGSIIRKEYSMVGNHGVEFRTDNSIELEIFPLLFSNLTNEGILGFQDKGLIVNDDDNKNEKLVDYYSSHGLQNEMDLIPYLDLERKQDLEHGYDFAFTHEISMELVDKVLKVDGIMIVKKKGTIKDSESFQKPSNYEIIYRKLEPRIDMTIIVMKKTRDKNENEASNTNNNNIPHRRLMFEQKKAEAIKNLENVLLEPPRPTSGKSNTYSKKTRYLPDLMDDSLEDYPRRVFIEVNGDGCWFTKNYPTRNMNFEIYQVETRMPETIEVDDEMEGVSMESEITGWLRENVKMDEYVVMKGEADVVEELVKSKAIGLVDELFLECKYQGIKCQKCRRPYWKCLALYGLLKDAGVAVHQWWG